MGWRGELSQVLLLCAVPSREHMARFWQVFFLFSMLLPLFCKLCISKDLGRMSVILHFLLQDKLVVAVPSIVNQESNGTMCDCLLNLKLGEP